MEEQQELTPRELAGALGVSIATVSRWRRAGCPHIETASFFIGHQASRPRYNLAAVKGWIQKQQQERARHE